MSNPCQNGGTCQDSILHYRCQCTTGYVGINCDNECREQSDVIIALDASVRNAGREEYYEMLSFVEEVAENMNFQQQRLGLLTYNGQPRIDIHLDEHTTKTDAIDAVGFNYSPRGSNAGPAIQFMTEDMFTRARRGARRVGVVVTDGQSTDRLLTRQASAQARENDITLLAMNIGTSDSWYDINELKTIANDPDDENIFPVNRVDNLKRFTEPLLDAICNSEFYYTRILNID